MACGRDVYHFDGGSRPAGIEVAAVHRGRTWLRDDLGPGDSGEAEWLALRFAVALAAAAGASDALFVGDCAAVIAQASGRAACRSARLRPHLAAYRAAAAAIGRVRLRHVPRSHNLAGIALDRRRRGAPA